MNFGATIEIQVPPEIAWSVLCDVERWPEWTRSVTSVRRLEAGPFTVGSRVRICQPKLLPAVWRVTELKENRNFTWVTVSPGIHTTAGHRVEPHAGGCRVTLSLILAGLLGPLVGRLMRSRIECYIQMEASGLKARSEERAKGVITP